MYWTPCELRGLKKNYVHLYEVEKVFNFDITKTVQDIKK